MTLTATCKCVHFVLETGHLVISNPSENNLHIRLLLMEGKVVWMPWRQKCTLKRIERNMVVEEGVLVRVEAGVPELMIRPKH